MSQSRQQLVNRVLLSGGGRAAGQSAAAEDDAAVDETLDPIMAGLAQRDIWQWGDPDDIDDSAFMILVDLLVNENYRVFGTTYDDGLRLRCEQRLRELKPVLLSGQPQQAEYF